ncbi:hypothetical protein [aff. Roholtiella sp. LEGE 12411]|uniref:hypothetical protein n=1 Tax=aff. Roholtiella sp. LEGE 12411 TaxID=1828822 RepID=UPI001ABD3C92|nr:hypothetical protein [aff. Roholtiella sp. LEGE 12411]
MANSENSNQIGESQGTSKSSTGNGNFSFTDGKWQSTDGSTLNSGAGNGSNTFASFSGGGNSSTTNKDGQHAYNYERPLDKRALTDTNNPFNQLIGVVSGGSPSGANNMPGNLPFGSTPPSKESGSNLPETGNGLPVPYKSDNWISDIQNLDGANATSNSGQGNGNWLYGSNNKTDGNGNWNFGSGNTTNGNGNWNYGDGGKTEGNGNWGFGSNNKTDGNGNWNLGNNNDIFGNANTQTGSENNIFGSGNTANVSNSNLLGNRIEASGDGKTLVGNEGWNFSVKGELISLGSTTPSEAIATDVISLLSSPDLVTSAMSNPGYNNPNYDFSATV